MPLDRVRLEQALPRLAELANEADQLLDWPQASWKLLAETGALRWSIATEYGGVGLEGVELLEGYEAIAGACLTTCFILSQREAACRRILDSGNKELCRALLPALAQGATLATVGLSQLTTSRQHGAPALLAEKNGGGWVLNGAMPWVTAAARADYFITGAVTHDGRQLLAALPRETPGIIVEPALDLMALQGSLTSAVRCEAACLDPRWLLAGPSEELLSAGRSGPGGLETSCLAIGLTGAALRYLGEQALLRPELAASTERLESAHRSLRAEMHRLAGGKSWPQAATDLRARANSLVLRATQATLTASKGTGFIRGHPAQRWARQALFFLVWSCPRPAAQATLDELATRS